MKRQLRSFKNAFKGIVAAFVTEGHMRFHFVAAFFVLLFAYISRMDMTQWAVLIITIGAVFSAELINTAIEELCDLYSTEHNPLIGKIKDIAAGAVLVASIAAVGVAVFLFVFSGKLMYAWERLLRHPLYFIPLGICSLCSVFYVIFGGFKNTKK
ncbi:MAG: diacylglycerol kinase family protein [Clostridia bacterium]|nr:diacylglycerol kinase family protein [Clostridia bacterium]